MIQFQVTDQMNVNRRVLMASVVTIVATVIVTVVQGRLTNRWGPQADLVATGRLLEKLPDTFGEWKGHELDMSESVLAMLECKGHVFRTYQNARTGDVISVAVLVGPPGPISVHIPEICYSARDYKIANDRTRWRCEAGERVHEFWDLRLQPKEVSSQALRVLYAWTEGDRWQAVDSPRFTFGGGPYLYKVQMAGAPPLDGQDSDAFSDFVLQFLPLLQEHIVVSK